VTGFARLSAAPILILAAAAAAQEAASPLTDAQQFNFVLGTQTFGPAYQFTGETRLVETAQAILDLGSNAIKFGLNERYFGERANVPEAVPGVASLTDLARDEPSHRRVLDMPFAYYLLWVYGFSPGWWDRGFSEADRKLEYDEMYAFVSYLLETYNGSGKTFYLGHWEGDWHLRRGYDAQDDSVVKPEAVEGMIAWLNARQQAIEDAKRDVPHERIRVYGYTEVNLAKLAMEGRPSVTNDVLPRTAVDFVSYSSYDSGTDLRPALDYIESKLPRKPGLPGKRVFIGEYGFPAVHHSPEAQDARSREVMRAGLEWGCPFVLYWELYNNEVDDAGRQRGFWLIDDLGVRQPVYETHAAFYARGREYVAAFRAAHGRLPTDAEFRATALHWLD